MKQLTLILLLFLSVSLHHLNAQEVHFGVKGGPGFSTFANLEGIEPKPVYHVGIFVNFTTDKGFDIQPEILFSHQGSEVELGNDEYKLGYLNIPLIVKINVLERFNFHIGPQLGVLLFAKADIGSAEVDYYELFNEVDFAACLGIGYKSYDNISVDFRYNYGISNIIDESFGVDDRITNQVIQLSLGIYIK